MSTQVLTPTPSPIDESFLTESIFDEFDPYDTISYRNQLSSFEQQNQISETEYVNREMSNNEFVAKREVEMSSEFVAKREREMSSEFVAKREREYSNEFVARESFCPSCTNCHKSESVFPSYEDPYVSHQMHSNPMNRESYVGYDDSMDPYFQQRYYEFPDEDFRYGMNYFNNVGMNYPLNMSQQHQRSMYSMEQEMNRGLRHSFSGDPRYIRHHMNMVKNDMEGLTKESHSHWKDIDVKVENPNEGAAYKYEGLMDVNKTIKKENKKKWRKMSQELFNQIVEFEKKNPNIKQCEIEKIFLVNRSTYWRWKKRLLHSA
jgi:hypothetical protein